MERSRAARILLQPEVIGALVLDAVALGLPRDAEFKGMRLVPFGGFELVFEHESFDEAPMGQPPMTLAITLKER